MAERRTVKINDCDVDHLRMLYRELGKVQAWLTGWREWDVPEWLPIDSSLRIYYGAYRSMISAALNKEGS